MFELRILGPPRIATADGRSVEALIRRSRRIALLAYLACAAPRGPHRRDKLLALFWPESDTQHARSALSQALYVLRTTLDEEAVLSAGDDQVSLNGSLIWCDAVAFEEQLDAGRHLEALALYRADLLDGFFVAGAPAFEEWLDQERQRLRRRASEGAWALARAAAAAGNAVEAARWARSAADTVPADEAVARRLMSFLHELGDRAAAMRAYEAFAWQLAHEYELEPSAETQGLAASIRDEEQERPAARAVKPSPGSSAARPRGAHRQSHGPRYIIVAAALTLLAAVVWGSLREQGPTSQPVMRFPLEFADTPPLASGVPGTTIALSPDGDHLVYAGVADQNTRLFLRSMDGLETAPIPHTRAARHPFFSPDGAWLGFVSANTLRKVRLAGGPAVTVSRLTTPILGASWGPGDLIVFATPAGLWRVPASGGVPQSLAAADTQRGEFYRWPDVLPNGRAVVFTRVDTTGYQLAAVSLDEGDVIHLGVEGTNPRFASPGYLVFAGLDGTLMAAPFDQAALRMTGNAQPVAEGVFVGGGGGVKLGLSRTGALAYVPEPSDHTLVLVDRSGRAETLPLAPRSFGDVRFSPDGKRIVMTIRSADEQNDIWMFDLRQTTLHRLTADTGSVAAVWSPDGRSIVFASNPGGRSAGFELRSMQVGGGHRSTLKAREIGQVPLAITPDGRNLLFVKVHSESQLDLWILPLEDGGAPTPYLYGRSDERAADISADGRWVAYVSDESGRNEVYIAGFPDPATPLRISSDGGWEPRWAPQGNELFFRTGDGMVAVTVRTTPSLSAGAPRTLFDDEAYVSWLEVASYDVHPDGQRFAMIRRGADSRNITIVLNWFEQFHRTRR